MANAPDPVDDLFVVPPEEFVAARNALAKQLRAGGERERAAEVAALRRPSVPDWALNVVAHGQAGELEPFFEAAQESREAQRAAASGREGRRPPGSAAGPAGRVRSRGARRLWVRPRAPARPPAR